MQQISDVTILGGGLAGLSAAKALLESSDDLRVCLIEARGRVGGRTCTESICFESKNASLSSPLSSSSVKSEEEEEETSIDLGGQWVGPLHSKMLALVRDLGLELLDQEFTCSQLSNSSRLVELTGVTMSRLSDAEMDELVLFSKKLEDLSIKLRNCIGFFDTEECQELDTMSVEDYVNKCLAFESVRSEILLFVQTILACDPRDCSALFLVHYIGSSGGMETLGDGDLGAQKWKIKGGSMQVSSRLLKGLQEKYGVSCIDADASHRFSYVPNTAIASIERVAGAGEPHMYNLYNRDNVICCSSPYVVVAMAPSLAVQSIKFNPPHLLREDRRQLFESYRMGSAIKVILFYKESFWTSDSSSRTMTVSSLLQNFDIHNIFITKSKSGLPGLVLLITGYNARKLSKVLSSDEAAFRELIFRQLSELYSVDISVTTNCLSFSSKDWCVDSFSAGCFVGVFPPRAMTEGCKHTAALFTFKKFISSTKDDSAIQNIGFGGPLPGIFNFSDCMFPTNCESSGSAAVDRELFWASSECSDKFCGYMEGALFSGEIQAARILEIVARNKA